MEQYPHVLHNAMRSLKEIRIEIYTLAGISLKGDQPIQKLKMKALLTEYARVASNPYIREVNNLKQIQSLKLTTNPGRFLRNREKNKRRRERKKLLNGGGVVEKPGETPRGVENIP